MGGRGGGGAVSRERMLSDFNALMREQGQLGPEQQIQRAIRALGGDGSTDWVDIADVRDRVDMPRAQFDRLIISMSTGAGRVLTAIPEDNQKTLTPRRRQGGVDIGGQTSHLIRIGD